MNKIPGTLRDGLEQQGIDTSLWRQWVLASIAGAMLGSLIIEMINLALPEPAPSAERIRFGPLGIYFGVFFLSISLFQWVILRRYVRKIGWWIIATTIGGGIGLPLAIVLTSLASGQEGAAIVSLFGTGGIIGIAQWLVLRNYIHKAGWWIVISTVAWPLAFIGVGSIFSNIYAYTYREGLLATLIGIIQQIMIWAVHGAVTGLVLAGLWDSRSSKLQ